jgi:hypothetical protein
MGEKKAQKMLQNVFFFTTEKHFYLIKCIFPRQSSAENGESSVETGATNLAFTFRLLIPTYMCIYVWGNNSWN